MNIELDEGISFPRASVRFPVELKRPPEMQPEDPATWPKVPGRLEYVGGRLLYMPPCADYQQDTATDVTYVLARWAQSQSGFIVGSNEAGMLLAGEIRAADVAIWRALDASTRIGRLRSTAPILAVEIAGEDEGHEELREKAGWYLERGVAVVWLVFTRTFEVVVIDARGEARFARGAQLPERAELPGLAPAVTELFARLLR